MVFCAKVMQHLDNFVASEVCGITHWWSPVIVTNAGVLMQQFRVLENQLSHSFNVVFPHRLDELTALDQTRPARSLVAAREHKLSVGECYLGRYFTLWMLGLEFFDCRTHAAAKRAQQIFSLILKLIEIGTNGKVTILRIVDRHTSLLWLSARSPLSGAKEVRCANLISLN